MRPARFAVPGYAAALTALVLGPLAAPGYLLLRDAVSTPRSWLPDSALGLGGTAPRAVPQDFAIATLSAIVDGGVLVKLLLAGALLAAGWGAGRLAGLVLPESGTPGQLVAVTLAIWNPYVAERLLQGHWSLLLGYGCLPWVAVAVLRLRAGGTGRDWAALVLFTALAGLTPTGAILAAIVAMVCVAAPGTGVGRGRCVIAAAAIALITAGPWLLASALGGTLGAPQSDGLAPFAARAEPGLATLGSLAGLGGIWNAEAVPSSRTTLFAIVGTVALLAVVAAGLPTALRRPAAVPLLVLAVASVLFTAAIATGPGLNMLRGVVEAVPGLAVLRDGQKWVALAMPGYTVAGAGAVLTLSRVRFGPRRMRPAVAAAACCAALIAVLPDLAWGVWGRAVPAHYPPGWAAVAALVNADPRPVATLPADTMRRFDWAGSAPVLDPMPRWLQAEVLFTGDLQISGRTVTGEGGRARAVQEILLAGADRQALERAGVGWVVLESGTPGRLGDALTGLRQLPVAYSDSDLTLYRVGADSPRAARGARLAVMGAHLVWAALVLGGAVALGMAHRRRQSGS
jgi:hypothetical protein